MCVQPTVQAVTSQLCDRYVKWHTSSQISHLANKFLSYHILLPHPPKHTNQRDCKYKIEELSVYCQLFNYKIFQKSGKLRWNLKHNVYIKKS